MMQKDFLKRKLDLEKELETISREERNEIRNFLNILTEEKINKLKEYIISFYE